MRRTIRLSQTLAPFGVGAIYDFLGESFVACDSYRWGSHGVRLRAAGLDKALGVKELRSAPSAGFGTHTAALRAHTGVAPVTRQSGRSLHVSMRRACCWRLQKAAYCWGMAALQNDPLSKAHYQRLRAAGHTHARALRGVVDRLLSVAVTMLRDRTLYDPHRRRKPQYAA